MAVSDLLGCDQYDGDALVNAYTTDGTVLLRVLVGDIMDATTPIAETSATLPAGGILTDLTWGQNVMQECSDDIDNPVIDGHALLVEGTWQVTFDFTGEYVRADLTLTNGVFEDLDTLERVDVDEWMVEDVLVSTNWGA